MTAANTKALELLGKDVSFEIDELVQKFINTFSQLRE